MTSVTESNRAIVTHIMEALSRGERQPFGDAMADDFTWHMMGTTAWSGTFAGKTDVRKRLIGPLFAQFGARYTNSPKRILADGDYVVVESRGNVTTKAGKPYCNTYCMVIRMREGKMVELTEYLDTELVSSALEPPAWATA
ncbi:nuclear transport factor 2 family protein [Steroidobacter sp. S1-65]|uniref:Nuclear transport factor 2 family protein n=1 Tax=Steroidobacter gossypii TaxID=2805490 RepID=A0ABS1WZQ2_9GAMM|nr:nuclear transport factor 2 family protein [Steroidobacter gossypii]MBM0106447.1 nuclear transport factor 2 family protein [Steroidobacter gossypii]